MSGMAAGGTVGKQTQILPTPFSHVGNGSNIVGWDLYSSKFMSLKIHLLGVVPKGFESRNELHLLQILLVAAIK